MAFRAILPSTSKKGDRMFSSLMTPNGKPQQLPMSRDFGLAPVPQTLPPLVKMYLTGGQGWEIPIVESARVWGRWRMRIGPLWLPGTHNVFYNFPQSMRREMSMYFFRLPVLRGLDTCDMGIPDARTVMAGKVLDEGPNVIQGSAMVLWLDSFIFRSRIVLSPEVQWHERGRDKVAMSYPLLGARDEVEITFADGGKRIIQVRAMRWKSSKARTKSPSRVDVHRWSTFDGVLLPSKFSITWEDDGKAWSVWSIGGVALNPNS